ncbi:hypothetical protein [Luteococcus peritonei]|uniref:Uncharacterized protein n=1 Tax=Luteococcus peritonei TaxID=88874 RepID=A0ABW4RT59_9ACTN
MSQNDARPVSRRRTHPLVLALFGLGALVVLVSVALAWRYLTPWFGTAPRCLAEATCTPAGVDRGLRNALLLACVAVLPWIIAMGLDAATRAPSPARRTDWFAITCLIAALSPLAVCLGFLVMYVAGLGAGLMAALAVLLLLAHLLINRMPDGNNPLVRRLVLWFGTPLGAVLGGLVGVVFTRPVLLGGIWTMLVYALFAIVGPFVVAWFAHRIGGDTNRAAWRIPRRFRPATD